MKEMNEQQTQLLIDYLNKRINRNRTAAETYAKTGNYQHAMVANAQAAELDCTLAYLLGIINEE